MVSNTAPGPANGCCVESVNGYTGVVVLTSSAITEGSNLYFTDARARSAFSGVAPIAFNPSNGQISHQTSGVTAGSYGSASYIPIITVNSYGHITAITTAAVSGGGTIGPDLTAIEALTGTGYLVRTASNTWALRSLSTTTGHLTITYPDGVTGNSVLSLTASGVSAGTYGSTTAYPVITVDGYGRVTNVTSQALPTAVIPPHTHSLGSLSNVDSTVDTAPVVGDSIIYDGTKFVLGTAVVGYEDTSITIDPASNWLIATGNNDVDATIAEDPINLVRRLHGTVGKSLVSVNTVIYIDWATFGAAPVEFMTGCFYIERMLVGSISDGYRPMHNFDAPLTALTDPSQYWNEDHSVQFDNSWYQVVNALTVHIEPGGDVYVSCAYIQDQNQFARLDGVTTLLVPITCTYPTKDVDA
jgi:hypothetical protein